MIDKKDEEIRDQIVSAITSKFEDSIFDTTAVSDIAKQAINEFILRKSLEPEHLILLLLELLAQDLEALSDPSSIKRED